MSRPGLASALALCLLLWVAMSPAARAQPVTVAVAANLLPTAQALVSAYPGPGDIRLAHGSTGRLYAQIVAGAPFDIFLSADADRPARLAQAGQAAETRPYALGRIVLVGLPDLVAGDPATVLAGRRLAIADPAVAPYGLAARQALTALGVDLAATTLITGDSVGQVAGFVVTGNVDAAVIALSQLPQVLAQRPLAHRLLDAALHDPIRQDAALLIAGATNPAAVAFWRWLSGAQAAAILTAAGYEVPAP